MKISRKKILIPVVIIAALALLVLMGNHCLKKLVALGSHHDVNPEKLVQGLKEKYLIKFPQEIEYIQASKAYEFNGTAWFLLVFEMPDDDLDTFINSFTEVHSLIDYGPDRDKRLKRTSLPDWFTTTIDKGKIAHVSVKKAARVSANNKKGYKSGYVVLNFDVCVDTSIAKKCIVYMSGIYDGHH
jgi:hypothetical protein